MMKTALLAISLSIFGLSFSQTTFIVTTTDGQPAVGAEVSKSGNLIGKTDENGKFTIERISKGDTLRFLLKLDLHIYAAKTDNPTKNQKISLNLTIPPPSQEEMMEESVYKEHYDKPDAPKIMHPVEETNRRVYMDVEENAEFPGGREAMYSFIKSNVKNPNVSYEGKCYIRVVVLEDGTLGDTRITRSAPDCPECDLEAIRVVKTMPIWEAGKIGGKKVKSYVDIAVPFKKL